MSAIVEKVPWSERINFRLVFFFGLVCLVVGFVMWQFLRVQLTGGIIDRGQYVEVDLKAISLFEMDQFEATDQDIPARFRELDGRRVVTIGEMYQPMAVGGKLDEFDLVYSIAKCCVTSSPKIQHFVKSKVMAGREARYYSGLVKVVGVLHVGVEKGGGRVRSIYRLDVESVEPWS